MRKRILPLGSILMAMALPLYADIPNLRPVALDNPSAVLHLRIAEALITGTGHLSILDTSRQLPPPSNPTDISSLVPAFKMSHPVAPVPEPLHYLLMGLGVVGLFLARRDRLGAR
jgi:hypothetical protein